MTMVYNSRADNDFHIDTFAASGGSDVVLNCTDLQLFNNTTDIVRNSVGVFAKLAELEAASGGLGTTVLIESETDNTSLTVKANRDASKSASLTIRADSDTANTGLADRVYTWETEPGNGDTLLCSALGSPAYRLFAGGAITFGNISSTAGMAHQVSGNSWFRADLKVGGDLEVVTKLSIPNYPDVEAVLDTISSPGNQVYSTANNADIQLSNDCFSAVWGNSNGSGSYPKTHTF